MEYLQDNYSSFLFYINTELFWNVFRLTGKGLEISIKLNYSVSLSSYKIVFCKWCISMGKKLTHF